VVGERALLAAGSMLAGMAFALLAMSQSYAALVALILLSGIGSAVQHPIASSLISQVYPPASRRAALGVYNFVGDVGKMTVAAAMGLGVVALGWRSSVALYGIVVAGVGILALVALASMASEARLARTATAPPAAEGWGFTDPTGFALLSAIQLIDSACRTGFLTFFPFLLIAKGASVASVGFRSGPRVHRRRGGQARVRAHRRAGRHLRTVILTELATGLPDLRRVALPLDWAMLLLIPVGVALNGTPPSSTAPSPSSCARTARAAPSACSIRWQAAGARPLASAC
jgi:MFS family permease